MHAGVWSQWWYCLRTGQGGLVGEGSKGGRTGSNGRSLGLVECLPVWNQWARTWGSATLLSQDVALAVSGSCVQGRWGKELLCLSW